MKGKVKYMTRAAAAEAMAETAASQVEKDALLRVAEGLLNQVAKPTEPRQAASKPIGVRPRRAPTKRARGQ
jgi:hypothetical protein